jgi:hypothetical protein
MSKEEKSKVQSLESGKEAEGASPFFAALHWVSGLKGSNKSAQPAKHAEMHERKGKE